MDLSMTFYVGFLGMVLAVIAAVGTMLFVRRRVDVSQLSVHHDVADPLLSVVGTLFSVLLGFLVAGAMTRFDEARINIQEEAGSVGHVFRLADGLEPATRKTLQHTCLDYVSAVLDEEWEAMEQKQASQAAWDAYSKLWYVSVTFEPKTDGQSDVHQALLDAMRSLGNFRIKRFAVMATQMPIGMWIVVFVGGIATIIMTYFFEVKSERVQIMMTALVATVMALNIFLLANYDYPFSGDVHVPPRAFELQRELFSSILNVPKPKPVAPAH
jgi:hypothetical protein